ncbi:DNA primase [Mobilicoccus pelagius]|uniref:DNA primase n=1 Tax=Mobilicoccus pelagius NBRC 104925 TaxID=1089455 RepID=H5UPY7_9MICO|nr:DNA primase [Mobilicoccus pelagius]GAB47792.1 DNA primase [Mobilicoccus pelagius NBRC 104925]
MGGRIKAEDVEAVKDRTSVEAVVREHVTLTRAGAGRLKGLCPFHDEKTPSFTIRPAVGRWHCFGCGEGGDVISFVQQVDHLTFTEAVERLAAAAGMELHYEEGGGPREPGMGRRARLVEAHRVAEEFYHEALLRSRDARIGRDFLRERGFDSAAATRFGVGYAPRGGEDLVRHLREKGFSEEEMTLGGLAGKGSRGLYDRFRGRLVWPIRDITGDTVGFGARRLYDDDRIAAKYLNTAETPIYKKTHLLYGLDLAKKAISTGRRAVVVEGYTDVMACHLAGVKSAVATCGTAFGADHVSTLRRILRDDAAGGARTVFTFDGDAAGQKAAMRAFELDQRWASQSYVAVAPDGMDPCELRQQRGDDAVRRLVDDAVPMFEFAVRTLLSQVDLDTAEGRVAGMKNVARIIAEIRDPTLRPEYTRTVAGWIGVDIEQMREVVAHAPKGLPPVGDVAPRQRRGDAEAGRQEEDEPSTLLPAPDLRDPTVLLGHLFLQVLVQFPRSIAPEDLYRVVEESFVAPAHRAVFVGTLTALVSGAADRPNEWIDAIIDASPAPVDSLVETLAMERIQARVDPETGEPDARYITDLLTRLWEAPLQARIADAASALRRVEHDDPARAHEIAVELQGLQLELTELRSRRE